MTGLQALINSEIFAGAEWLRFPFPSTREIGEQIIDLAAKSCGVHYRRYQSKR